MVVTRIFKIFPVVVDALRPRPVAIANAGFASGDAAKAAGQRGFSTLMLALIGLLAGSSLAVPAMQLAAGTLTSSVGPAATIDADSAAEHALWRLRYDPTIHDEMTGSPPETNYILSFPSGDANVNVAASSDPPLNNGLTASLTVTPSVILEEVAATVTYTLTLTNDDSQDHDVTRFEANPVAFNPTYLGGTTTGATTSDPVYQAGRWRWDLITPITVTGFGGSTHIHWQMSICRNPWSWENKRVRCLEEVDLRGWWFVFVAE